MKMKINNKYIQIYYVCVVVFSPNIDDMIHRRSEAQEKSLQYVLLDNSFLYYEGNFFY